MNEYEIGFFRLGNQSVVVNKGRKWCELNVKNDGERTIQVGSHFHFFEVNKALNFDREKAFGMHLDIPSGTAIRFKPGKTVVVRLTAYGGKQYVLGFNGLTNGCVAEESIRQTAIEKAAKRGFMRRDEHEL